MEFDLDDDQRALRDEARRFLEREAPVGYAREMLEDPRGWRDDVWRKAADLGWTALPFPEDAGGLGQGFVALAILLAEMGRVVHPGPVPVERGSRRNGGAGGRYRGPAQGGPSRRSPRAS